MRGFIRENERFGIDLGTTGGKVALYSPQGDVLASVYREYDIQRPQPGQAELDSLAVWKAVKDMIRAAVAGAPDVPVTALAVSSLGEATVPVTADRRILGPSILNFDIRGEEYLDSLRKVLSDEHLYRINGNTLGNHYSLTKLKWIKERQPDLYERTYKFLHWSDSCRSCSALTRR
jgi:xylulokinase